MSEQTVNPYTPQIIEFTTVADQICRHLEHVDRFEKGDFLEAMQKLLTLLYLKSVNLPRLEPILDGGNERFVQESDWIRVDNAVSQLIGADNRFEELYDDDLHEGDESTVVTISEYMADVYQDLKDYCIQYQTGTEEVMNDALWECMLNFERSWGKKLLGLLRVIHRILYGKKSGEIE
jgi:hypothetical protein